MVETIFTPDGWLALPGRAVVGLALALLVAGAAWRAGSLNRSGSAAATVCGTLCAAAGWNWAFLLILYFVAASVLSRAGKEAKEARLGDMVEKGGRRDYRQVVANGGVYSIAAALGTLSAELASGAAAWIAWGAIGALAAASSDTWATEIGTWLGGRPRSVITWAAVAPGESGGVTAIGLAASVAGALWIGLGASLPGFPRGLGIAAIIAGIGGSIADSVLGATIQERRWCDACRRRTERAVHRCGSVTRRIGGIPGLDNDVVNLLSTLAGFVLGVIVYCIVVGTGPWSAID
jgi:uncharacterized protein (TIGR00297 family)